MPDPLPRLVALASLALFTACDRGHYDIIEATPNPADLCPAQSPAAAAACPPCSTPDQTGLCRDAHYAALVRCAPGRGEAACAAAGGRCDAGQCVFTDEDHDALDDQVEREVAERNLPALHMHPSEHCGGPRGILFRARRHPDAPARLALTYVVLYARDCGPLNGHVGDNEGFAVTIDLDARPGAPAAVGVIADAHRNTVCQSISACTTAPGTSACAGEIKDGRVHLFISRDKHATYLDTKTCAHNCFDECAPGPVDPAPRLLDVGQPDAPLATDLTNDPAGGAPFIAASMGWDFSLFHYNPWSADSFGHAGHVGEQLRELIAPAGL